MSEDSKSIKILFLANWNRKDSNVNADYAFFKHFKNSPRIRFLGTFDIPFFTWLEKRFFKFYILQSIVAFFLSYKFDLVLAYSSQCGLPLAFLYRITGRTKAKLVVFDVETFGRPVSGLRKSLTTFAIGAIDHVVYAATGQLEFYRKQLPEILDRSTHIPIGIGEYKKFMEFDSSKDSRKVIAIGKHDRRFRDWATLLGAFDKVKELCDLEIVGREVIEPHDRNGLSIPSNVELTPYLPIDQLGAHVEKARFAILPLPERNQSLGQLSVLFLMTMGKAVIVSKVIGVEDYVEEGVTGLFYEPGDPDDLAAKIKMLMGNPELALQMGRNARKAVEEKFNDRIMGQRWESCIRKVLGID